MMMLQLYYVLLYVFLREIGGKNQFEMLCTYISMEVLIGAIRIEFPIKIDLLF